jgi:hypothetical protein
MADAVSMSHARADFMWRPSERPGHYQAPEAFLCILALAATVDHAMGRLESELLQAVTHRWGTLGVVREKDVTPLNSAVTTRLGAGFDAALDDACAALPQAMRTTVFAQAFDMMLCDGALCSAEAAFADTLADKLKIDAAEAARIRDVLVIKNAL